MDTLFLIKSKPKSGSKVEDGLRLILAMIGMNHIPFIAFLDDGVECLLNKDSDEKLFEYLNTISNLTEIYALSDAISKRLTTLEKPRIKVKLIDIENIADMMIKCKIILVF